MGEKGVGKLSQETSPPREGEPMGVDSTVNSSHTGKMWKYVNLTV